MWEYQKKLQYPVKIARPNPAMAKLVISQLGGPDGELGASMRYLNQRYTMPYKETKGVLTDIGVSVSILLLYMKRGYIVAETETSATIYPLKNVVLHHFKT